MSTEGMSSPRLATSVQMRMLRSPDLNLFSAPSRLGCHPQREERHKARDETSVLEATAQGPWGLARGWKCEAQRGFLQS